MKTFHIIESKFILMSLAGSLFVHYIEKYLFSDWEFGAFMAVTVILDSILGMVAAYKTKSISADGFGKVFQKVIIYICLLVTTHVLVNFKIHGESNPLFSWLDSIVYSGVMLREAISIFEKISLINPSLVPTTILSRLKKFDDNGQIKETETAQ